MTFEEFMALRYAEAAEYACGVTGGQEDIARAAWEEATLAEREACAVECERIVMYPGGPARDTVGRAARAIRARGSKEQALEKLSELSQELGGY